MFDIISIGTVTRDVFLQSEAFKGLEDESFKKHGISTGKAQCFQMGAKIHVERPVFAVGGGGANSAITFARQRLNTAVLAKVGNDDPGNSALGVLRKEGVTPLALRATEEMTGYSTLLLSMDGERTVLTYRGAANDISKKELPLGKLQAQWAYIAPGRIPFVTVEKLVEHFLQNGTKIAMDPSGFYLGLGKKKLAPILEKLDMVKMNREEAAQLTGKDFEDEGAIFTELDSLVSGIAIMTEGPEGVVVSDGENKYRAGVFEEKQVADRTGAGDAFGSGFVTALARAGEVTEDVIREAIRLGSANATSVVEHVGAQEGALTKEESSKRRWRSLDITLE